MICTMRPPRDRMTAAGVLGASIGNDSLTKLLLHCDGADASTTFTDSSASARTVTANGNAQLDTAQSNFGGASLLLDGTGDYASCASSADLNMQTAGNWTVDCRVRPNNLTGSHTIAHFQSDVGGAGAGLHIYTSGTALLVDNGLVGSGLSAGTLATATWFHIAIVRSSGTILMFLDGTQIDSEAAQNYGDGNSTCLIGRYTSGGGITGDWNGWIDEFRVSKGVARWTANFTVPDVAYY